MRFLVDENDEPMVSTSCVLPNSLLKEECSSADRKTEREWGYLFQPMSFNKVGKIIDIIPSHTTTRSTDNAVVHADALSRAIDPSVPPRHKTKLVRMGRGVLQDPEHLEEPITAPATFRIGEAANEFQNVAAVETGVRRLWAILGDLKAGRAFKVSAGDYNLLWEVVSEDFDRIVKHLDGPVHDTFVSRLTQIRNWIGVEDFGAFRERLDARRRQCQLDVQQ